jgi:ABC-type lipoprotein export system ATPase subunit
MALRRISAEASSPLLAFRTVSKSECDGTRARVVLDRVSFELEAGASLGIYGARRSGKSTLLRLAAGLDFPEEGSVYFEGREPARMSTRERARLLRGSLALLTSEDWPASPGETVMDNVAMSAGSSGLSLREARRAALGALDRVGAAGICAQEMAGSLSPCERARVLLARALVRGPRLLVVDEPAPIPSLIERDGFCALLRTVARERGIALLVASEELSALQGLETLATISAGELCTAEEPGKVVELQQRRSSAGERR